MEIKDLADGVIKTVKAYVLEKTEALNQKIENIEKSIKSMPIPKDGKDADEGALRDYIDQKISAIRVPEDGKSVTLDDVQPLIFSYIDKQIAGIPVPKDGKSADMEALKSHIDQTISKIKMPEDGKSVTVEDVKPMIFDYIERQVEKIPTPRNGEDGLDALDIEILPAINDMKSYPRGVYAKHKGGLWRSQGNTDGMRGWECIIEGVDDIKVDVDGERNFKISISKSSGSVVEKDFFIPVAVYRDVHQSGKSYQRGDMVTLAGSVWHCNEDTDERPGAGSKAWKLAVKRGRDAKESVKIGGEK